MAKKFRLCKGYAGIQLPSSKGYEQTEMNTILECGIDDGDPKFAYCDGDFENGDYNNNLCWCGCQDVEPTNNIKRFGWLGDIFGNLQAEDTPAILGGVTNFLCTMGIVKNCWRGGTTGGGSDEHQWREEQRGNQGMIIGLIVIAVIVAVVLIYRRKK